MNKETIVFMGSMNAMPMMYALELRARGYKVIYFVDAPKKDTLSRPENHFPQISYPYPEWIVEMTLPTQILLPILPKIFSYIYLRYLRKMGVHKVDYFVLNGFYTSLAPYLPQTTQLIALSHGSDLDAWADVDNIYKLQMGYRDRSIFKFMTTKLSDALINMIAQRQLTGYKSVDVLMYFPIGFNEVGDKIVDKLLKIGVKYVPRYDISFEPVSQCSREYKEAGDKLVIFSGVRFLYKTFPDGNEGYNKGNDKIIAGIAKYHELNKNIIVHFVEKGEDVSSAKEMCQSLGLSDVVVWHREMKFKDLVDLYLNSDVCFDQTGCHWIGAIGGYALWLGKPLIADDAAAVKAGIWPIDNPVCSANSAEDVCNWLIELDSTVRRREISNRSKIFVEKYMSPNMALDQIFSDK